MCDFSWSSGVPVLRTRCSIELLHDIPPQHYETWGTECDQHVVILFSSYGTIVVVDTREGVYDVWEANRRLSGPNGPIFLSETEELLQRVGALRLWVPCQAY